MDKIGDRGLVCERSGGGGGGDATEPEPSWDVSLINDRDTGYIERESTYRSKPSDALASTLLTIRNITLGNLLSMAKSANGASVANRTVSPAATLRMAPIY